MKSIGLDKSEWESMRTTGYSDTQLSERAFNLIFSGTLLWGFLVNYLLVVGLQRPLLMMMLRNYKQLNTIMIVFLVAYLVLCFLGSRMMRAETVAQNFIGFNLIAVPVGVLLSMAMTAYVGQPDLVSHAVVLTIGITAVMMSLSMLFPQLFSGLGRILGISLLTTLVVELVAALFFHTYFGVTDYVVAGLMCLYIGFDWGRVSTCRRDARNAIMVAASLYLDIINLFLRILAILAKSKSKD